MGSKLKSWREALREYSELNLTAKEDPGNDLALPHSRYQEGKDKKPNFSYPNKEKMMMLRFAHRFTTHNRFTEPQQLCQDILNFYTSHPDSPEWLKNITVLLPGTQPSATAGGLSAAADEPITEITLEKALRLCVDLVRTELRPGRYSRDYPLHDACEDGSALIVELLLKNGADIKAKNAYSNTPLHVAARNGNTEVVKLLLEQGADINAKNFWSDTPLHWAASNGNTEAVKLLLEYGADINVKDSDGDTPLHLAAGNGKTEVVKRLLERDANPYARNNSGDTPLHVAASNGNTEVVELLLKNGADINAKNFWSDTPLHGAARNGNTEVVKLLLEQGADINAKNFCSDTPLQLAESKNHTEIIQLLKNSAQKSPDHLGSRALAQASADLAAEDTTGAAEEEKDAELEDTAPEDEQRGQHSPRS
jgi:ankyrin repeat protein